MILAYMHAVKDIQTMLAKLNWNIYIQKYFVCVCVCVCVRGARGFECLAINAAV